MLYYFVAAAAAALVLVVLEVEEGAHSIRRVAEVDVSIALSTIVLFGRKRKERHSKTFALSSQKLACHLELQATTN